MNLQATKIELIEMLLNTQKIQVLQKVKTVLEEENSFLSDDDYKTIDFRREKHLKKESKSYTWEEAKKIILQNS